MRPRGCWPQSMVPIWRTARHVAGATSSGGSRGPERIAPRLWRRGAERGAGAIGYGLPVFKLAADLLPQTDLARPDPDAELFRRFMFLPYRPLRRPLFQAMTREGWERLAEALEEATRVRLRAMGWERPS